MAANSEPISVTLLDREFQFACSPDEREALRDAARHLDERLRQVKSTGRLVGMDRIAIMAALNLADELLKLKGTLEERSKQVDRRIRMLADELDDALDSAID